MRATVRKYTSRPVGDELLNSLLEKASHTQTMGNLQLYSVIVTRDEAMKERLAPAHFSQPMVTGAPVVLTFCADFRRTTDWALNRQGHPGYDNFLSYQNTLTDALLFCQCFCDLAEAEGLGLCFLGTTVYNPQLIIDVLRLPALTFPVATITLGWPDETPQPSDRLPLEAFVHNETYNPYSPERIDAIYANKESLPENCHFVEVNGKETLAQVFTDIRYTAEANHAMSITLDDAIRRQGFQGDVLLGKRNPRPESLECDIVRFQNKKDRWVAFVGLLNGRPYEIFTGILDDDEGIMIPKSVSNGHILRRVLKDGSRRYDFQFVNKRGYKITIEGLSERFNPEYWNYAKLISGILRYGMPMENVIALISSLQLDSDNMNTWVSGVAKALKRYVNASTTEIDNVQTTEETDD
ncbi:MAG: nitroreductase family protein [Bacteroidaceae bacterium]|nr:nitroreductase family protein [Bacteroidaceae bacterium]